MSNSSPPPFHIEKAVDEKALKYSPSKSNLIYLLLTIVVMVVAWAAFTEHATAEQVSRAMGELLCFLIFPMICGWVTWKLARNKQKASSLAFNIVLTLLIFGQLGERTRNAQAAMEMEKIEKHKQSFKESIANAGTSEDYEAAYNDFSNSVQGSLRKLERDSSGEKKRYYSIMADFIEKAQRVNQAWMESQNAVMDPRVLDYSILAGGEAYEEQRGVIAHYIEETKFYQEYFRASVPDLAEKMSVLKDRSLADDTIKGAKRKYDQQSPIMEPLVEEHLDYGRNLVLLLDFLKSNHGQWSYENEQLLFDTDAQYESYTTLINRIGANEMKIYRLSQQIAETF